nr:hypothetical protein [Streptomyces blattellae]
MGRRPGHEQGQRLPTRRPRCPPGPRPLPRTQPRSHLRVPHAEPELPPRCHRGHRPIDVIAELLHHVADESTGPVRVPHTGALRGHATPRLLEAIEYAEATTVQRDGMAVRLGVGYDGHDEVRQAAH